MHISNSNLLKSLPEELFDSPYNNEDSKVTGGNTPPIYEEEIPPYVAQALLPSNAYDPAAKYRLVSERDTTTLVKISYRCDTEATVDKIEEFDLNTDDEVQTLQDIMREMHTQTENLSSKNKHVRSETRTRPYGALIMIIMIVILVLVGLLIIQYCLNFGR